jgi:hypothetical protein
MVQSFNDYCEAQEVTKTFILTSNGKKYKYEGKVGGAMWDMFIVNARSGSFSCYLIDAMSVEDAKSKVTLVQPTTLPNVFVYGNGAIAAIAKQGGKVTG